MPRSDDYDKELSERLQNPEYARFFIESLMEGEDGLSPEEALRLTITSMGIKEFARLVNVPAPRVVEFTKQKRNFKPETLDVFLKPFGLKTRVVFEKVS